MGTSPATMNLELRNAVFEKCPPTGYRYHVPGTYLLLPVVPGTGGWYVPGNGIFRKKRIVLGRKQSTKSVARWLIVTVLFTKTYCRILK